MSNINIRNKVFIVLLAGILVLLCACSQNNINTNQNDLPKTSKGINATQGSDSSVWPNEFQVLFSENQNSTPKYLFALGMQKSEVQSILKEKNIKITFDESHGIAGSSLWGENILLFFDKDQKLIELFIKSKVESSKGLRIGDRIDKVYELYGKEQKSHDEQDNTILQYIYSSNVYNISINKDKVVVGMGIKTLDTQNNTNDSADSLKTKQSSMENKDSKQDKLADIEWPKFSCENYSYERDIVKKQNKEAINEIENGKYGNIKKVEIAIGIEDLNDDGKKEILAILFHPYFSGYQSNGLIKIYENDGQDYKEIPNPMRINININSDGSQKEFGISNSSALQWKDLVIGKKT